MDYISPHVENLRWQTIQIVLYLSVLEYMLLWIQGKPLPKLHENVLSFAHGFLSEVVRLAIRLFEYNIYIYIWQHYGLELPKNFMNTIPSFILSAIVIDLGYYWFHRASHEIMLFWAVHQVHHSSEDYSVAVNIRHSPLQHLFSWIFYVPMAFMGLPPSHLVVHLQINLIYQTLIHTTLIGNLGWCEYIFNTPSHHRVHHGSDRYCINVNYGGIFICWDHLFGTFTKERLNKKITYGIVTQPPFWNPLYHQFFYLEYMISKMRSMSNWWHSASAAIKGPSWMPGSSWTGMEHYTDIDTGRSRVWCNASTIINSYAILHLLSTYIILVFVIADKTVSTDMQIVYAMVIIGGIGNIGILYEGRSVVKSLEIVRCLAGLLVTLNVSMSTYGIKYFLTTLFSASAVIWMQEFSSTQIGLVHRKKI